MKQLTSVTPNCVQLMVNVRLMRLDRLCAREYQLHCANLTAY